MRIKNLEFIRNGNNDTDCNRDPEIVAWSKNDAGKEYRYTLLWWRKTSEEWRIEFVGSRPLEFEDWDTLCHMMVYGQAVLDAEARLIEAT